jgi:hypothetical protein
MSIESDKKVRRFIAQVKQGNYYIDTDALMIEIQEMHSARFTRALTTTAVIKKFQTSFIDSVLQNSAFRSRATEIKMKCTRIIIEIDKKLPIIKKYIKARYSEELRAQFSTQADRDSYVDVVLQTAVKTKSHLEGVIRYADMFIADLDSNGWSLKYILDAVNVSQDKKGTNL